MYSRCTIVQYAGTNDAVLSMADAEQVWHFFPHLKVPYRHFSKCLKKLYSVCEVVLLYVHQCCNRHGD